MSILYCDNFKFCNGEQKKFPEFADSSISRRNPGHGNEEREDYVYARASSLEVESMIERFVSSCNRADDSGSQTLGGFAECFVKQETSESEFLNGSSSLYRNQEFCPLPNPNSASVDVGTTVESFINSIGIENSLSSARNFPNLSRQSSCPAEFSNILAMENGFCRTQNSRSFETANVNSNVQFNFSNELPLSSKRVRKISGENVGSESSNGHNLRNYSNQQHVISFHDNSWDESAFRSLKRARDDHGLANTDSPSSVYGLTHHLSLPNTFSEMATRDKLSQFQDAVPWKIRAKRGCATHPRSIAERVRRTRISERMRKLQDLFPNMDPRLKF